MFLCKKFLHSYIFLFSFCYWFLAWFWCSQRTVYVRLKFFWICKKSFYDLGYSLSWWIFRGCLKKCNLLLLVSVFLYMSISLFVDSVVQICILANFLIVLSFVKRWVLKSPTIIMPIFHYRIISHHFMYPESPLLGIYTYRIVVFSWWVGSIHLSHIMYLFVSNNALHPRNYFICIDMALPAFFY